MIYKKEDDIAVKAPISKSSDPVTVAVPTITADSPKKKSS